MTDEEFDEVIKIREYNPFYKGETEFILSTWLRDLRDADPSGLPNDLWFGAHRAHVKNILASRNSVALVAVAADQPTEILGYIVGTKDVCLEWVYVRNGMIRQSGVAKRLLAAAQMEHLPARWMTKDGKRRLRNSHRSRQLRNARTSQDTSRPLG